MKRWWTGACALAMGLAMSGAASAEQIVVSTREEIPAIVDRVMAREHPQLWRDLPSGVLAVGNPCRVLRSL